ncbi:unnamed protein product, partial [Cochlearia groenlandica]
AGSAEEKIGTAEEAVEFTGKFRRAVEKQRNRQKILPRQEEAATPRRSRGIVLEFAGQMMSLWIWLMKMKSSRRGEAEDVAVFLRKQKRRGKEIRFRR